MSLLLKGGTVVDPSQQLEDVLDLLIDEGRITGLGIEPKAEIQARVVDVDGSHRPFSPGQEPCGCGRVGAYFRA